MTEEEDTTVDSGSEYGDDNGPFFVEGAPAIVTEDPKMGDALRSVGHGVGGLGALWIITNTSAYWRLWGYQVWRKSCM